MPRVLKDIRITEVSSVDRGAGRGVKVMLMKRDEDPSKLTTEADMPTVEEIAKKLDDALTLIGTLQTSVTKGEKAAGDAITMITALKHENAILKMSDAHKAYMDSVSSDDAKKSFAAMSADERDAHMKKNPVKKAETDPVAIAALAKAAGLETENADLKKRLGALEADKTRAEFSKRAESLGLKAEHGEIMRKAYSGDAAAQGELDKLIKTQNDALDAARKTGKIFGEFGKRGTDAGATALDQLNAKADELRKTAAGAALTPQQAFTKVYTDPANAELVQTNKAEEARGRLQVVA